MPDPEKQKGDPVKGAQVPLPIEHPDISSIPRLYSNYCTVDVGNLDVTLVFYDVETPTGKKRAAILKHIEEGKDIPPVEPRPVAKIVMPPSVARGLKDALDKTVGGQSIGDTGEAKDK